MRSVLKEPVAPRFGDAADRIAVGSPIAATKVSNYASEPMVPNDLSAGHGPSRESCCAELAERAFRFPALA